MIGNELREMLEECIKDGMNYAFIVTDASDYSIYAVGVIEEMFEEVYNALFQNRMIMIMEIYNLNLDIDKQLKEDKAFHYPSWWKTK